MMSIKVSDEDTWSLDYVIEKYEHIKELEGYFLWMAKQKLVFGDFTKFIKYTKKSERSIYRVIEHFEAKKTLSILPPAAEYLTEAEAMDIVTDKNNPINTISPSKYCELKGKTPEEKLEYHDTIKKSIGKESVSRIDIRTYKQNEKKTQELKQKDPMILEPSLKPLSEKEAIAQTNKEYKQDYYKLCNGGISDSLGVFNIGFELHKFDKDWHSIKRILSKAAHPDVGGSEEAMQFVSMLNKVFKDKKKTAEETQLKKDMTNRITDLMGVTNTK